MATDKPPSKHQKTSDAAPYEILYWPSIPGRGEFIRLCFEAAHTPYDDVSNANKDGIRSVLQQISADNLGDATNPPLLAPPILKHGDLFINQLPNILLYLGPKLGLAGDPSDDNAIFHVNQLALTALDGFSNEVHDTHHPVAIAAYYDEQKDEAKRRSKDYIENRLPKFFGYFERVLKGEASQGGEWLYGGMMTWADLVLWQGIDGVSYAFPKAVAALKEEGKYEKVFRHQAKVAEVEGIREYLASGKRLKYGNGVYRQYPELDLGAE